MGIYGYEAAISHWLTNGKAERRNGRPYLASLWVIGSNNNASPWDDYRIRKGQQVTGFRIRVVKNVHGIQFLYPGGWAPVQARLDGASKQEVLLDKGEYIHTVTHRRQQPDNDQDAGSTSARLRGRTLT